ncbi:MAG: hypothetical protein JWR84_1857 [Caulobacter sp.]|nr:hypothetical protein [Caulobacter sp.]
MKPLPLALGAATLVAFAACIGLSLYAGMPVQSLLYLFLDAEFITKLADMLLLVMVGLAAFLPRGRGQGGGLLTIIMGLALGLGLLITLLNASFIYRAVQMSGMPDLRITAPSLAEGLLPLALGLLAGFLAAARAGKRPATT